MVTGQRPLEAGPGKRADEDSSGAADGEREKAAHAGAIGAAGVREDGLKTAERGPAHVGDSGDVAEDERRRESNAPRADPGTSPSGGPRRGCGGGGGSRLCLRLSLFLQRRFSFCGAGAPGTQWRKWRMRVKTMARAELVGGGDDVLILDGAAGLDDGGGSGCGDGFESVGERGRKHPRRRRCRRAEARLSARRTWRRPDAAHLACADADGLGKSVDLARVDNGVGLDVFADAPGEDEAAQLLGRGRTPG